MIHPQEALLQEARAFQQSEAFAPYRKLRQAAEHRLAVGNAVKRIQGNNISGSTPACFAV